MPGGEACRVQDDKIILAAAEAIDDAEVLNRTQRPTVAVAMAGVEVVRLVGSRVIEKPMIADLQNAEALGRHRPVRLGPPHAAFL